MHSLSAAIPFVLLLATLLWMKPWKKEISSRNLLLLIFIDSFSIAKLFNLNFYKIFAIFRLQNFFNSKKNIKIISLILLVLTLASGLLFLIFNPDIRDPNSSTFINLPFIRILRHMFTLGSSLIIGYEIYLKLKKEPIEEFIKPMFLIGYIIALGIFIEVIFKIDLYSLLTGGRSLLYGTDYLRARGFAYEPRGAAQVLSFCLVISICFSNNRRNLLFSLVATIALFFTKALSGLFILSFFYLIILTSSIYFKNNRILKNTLLSSSFFILILLFFLHLNLLQSNLNERSYLIRSKINTQSSFLDKVINRFEVFDAAYLNFLKNNPSYLILGTGSGLGGFASQKYILEKDLYIFPKGSTSLPLMGAVYLLSQFGLIFSLWLLMFILIKLDLKNKNLLIFKIICLLFFMLQYYYFICFLFAILFLQKTAKERKTIY